MLKDWMAINAQFCKGTIFTYFLEKVLSVVVFSCVKCQSKFLNILKYHIDEQCSSKFLNLVLPFYLLIFPGVSTPMNFNGAIK